MLNGLDLFTGIGGISYALQDFINPVAYCEIDTYCQSILLSRMQEGDLPKAPIWDDIKTLSQEEIAEVFGGEIDIIFGGFPCQDISCAGHGKGLEGERSGLFFEIIRLCGQLKPGFIFLENVPAITVRGGAEVVREITSLGYDCRWCVISAASTGALHRRERWFLLAHSTFKCDDDGDSNSVTSEQTDKSTLSEFKRPSNSEEYPRRCGTFKSRDDWQKAVREMGKCSNGIPNQLDRLRALGNSVVPQQLRKAFELLKGRNNE